MCTIAAPLTTHLQASNEEDVLDAHISFGSLDHSIRVATLNVETLTLVCAHWDHEVHRRQMAQLVAQEYRVLSLSRSPL